MTLNTISFILLFAVSQGAVTTNKPLGTNCMSSYECGTGVCCRDAAGHLVDGNLDPQGPFGHLAFGGQVSTSGTCSSKLGQKGDVCDSNCGCDQGLECYRPMSGVCCPPMTCYDATYVKQQREYWHNCFSNPSCPIPP
ncbi:hypothetical protein CHS0354_009919 [Potamilus streckersoni]|uniref:Uncharacterized protein n=1 Tax=Potamilus streckersoni TaxID=2493646 RepID=A0AAE0TDL1_9BIVA|nr:hypothetical protein CHS0354_009919 [Potamilus streckersoni]